MTPTRRENPLIKKGETYWCDFYLNGKRVRRSMRTPDFVLAHNRLRVLREKLETQYAGGRISLEGFSVKYLEWAWAEKPRSAQREEQRLAKIREYLKMHHNVAYLDEVTSYHIEQLKAHLKTLKLSKATINRYLQIVRGMFYKAMSWNMHDGKNPVRGVRFYKERSPIDPLADAQIDKILDSAERMSRWPRSAVQREFHDICLIALNTGMRKGEILNMQWKDVKDDFILVDGKGERQREVPINEAVRSVLDSKPRRSRFAIDIQNRTAQDPLRKSVARVESETGIKWNFHQLRHHFATKLLEKGVDIVTISRILGHSKITTSLIYSHTDKGKMLEAVGRLK